MDIRRVFDPNDAGVAALVEKSDQYLSALYPPESNHAEPLDALVSNEAALFAGYIEGRIAACGGVRVHKHDVRYGEIKRVFVDEQHRGKRLAVAMMDHLERYLVENDITVARLEAGPKQPEALKLYRRLGYQMRGPFGSYAPDPLSVFMEKRLIG
ncbi:MAG: GNAT family N-acetyltransferase [Pseudomonadota bacterium]